MYAPAFPSLFHSLTPPQEVFPSLPVLLNDPFASHILRALLSILAGIPPSSTTSQSKKSKKWKDRQGGMKSLFDKDEDGGERPAIPAVFGDRATAAIRSCRGSMSGNEVRACAASRVACPTLDVRTSQPFAYIILTLPQVLVTVEAERGLSNEAGSLMDLVTGGLVSDTCSWSLQPLPTSHTNFNSNSIQQDLGI